MAAKETVGVKLDSDLAQKFRELQKEHGTAQEFVEVLMTSYMERQVETDTTSPVHKEKVRVKKALADIERVMASFLELAADDKLKAKAEAEEKIVAAQSEIADLKETTTAQADTIKTLDQKNADLENQVATLQESAENIQALKKAWEIEKGNIATRITELDAEAQEARKLKSQVQDLEKTIAGNEKQISDFQGQAALASQQHKNDQAIIKDVRNQLEESKSSLATSQDKLDQALADLQTAREELSAEQLACKDRELQLQQTHSTEKEELLARVGSLEKELTALPPALEKIIGLEKDLASTMQENGKLAAQVEKLGKAKTEKK